MTIEKRAKIGQIEEMISDNCRKLEREYELPYPQQDRVEALKGAIAILQECLEKEEESE